MTAVVPRLISADYPCRDRGGAATRLHGISTSGLRSDRPSCWLPRRPAQYNVRFLALAEKPPYDVFARRGPPEKNALAGAVLGPVEMLHGHSYQDWMKNSPRGLTGQARQVCGVLNRDEGVRVLGSAGSRRVTVEVWGA